MAKLNNLRQKYNQIKAREHQKAVQSTVKATQNDIDKAKAKGQDNKILEARIKAAKALKSEERRMQKLKAELVKYNKPGTVDKLRKGLKNEVENFKKTNPQTYRIVKKLFT